MSGWDAEVEPAKWNPPDVGASDSAGGSGYPETKDESGGGNGEPQAWQGAGGNGHPSGDSTVISAPAAGGGGSGVGGFIQPLSGDGGRNGRRHTMAFEIARVERSGKTTPPNPHLAKRVWELSRPRYIETLDGTSDVKRRLHVPPGKESQGAVPYRVWGTSWAQMGDFGLDVGMYFVTFAQLMGAVLVYAALSIVAMVHFSSEEYSDKQVGAGATIALLEILYLTLLRLYDLTGGGRTFKHQANERDLQPRCKNLPKALFTFCSVCLPSVLSSLLLVISYLVHIFVHTIDKTSEKQYQYDSIFFRTRR